MPFVESLKNLLWGLNSLMRHNIIFFTLFGWARKKFVSEKNVQWGFPPTRSNVTLRFFCFCFSKHCTCLRFSFQQIFFLRHVLYGCVGCSIFVSFFFVLSKVAFSWFLSFVFDLVEGFKSNMTMDDNNVGHLEEEALKRKQRLEELRNKRKHLDGANSIEQMVQEKMQLPKYVTNLEFQRKII